jgi:putative ABC transport system permease protein
VPFRRESGTINGDATALSTADFQALSSVTKIEFVDGSFADLVPGTIIAVDQGIVADPDVEALTVVGDTAPTVAFIDVASGAQTDTEEAIDDLTSRRPDITVTRGNAIGELVGAIFDFLISAVDGLLVMSVVASSPR